MTAMISYQDNPRYQRIVAKFAAMAPKQRAIRDTALADQAFAGEAMQSHLKGFISAADARNRARSLDIRAQSMANRRDIASEAQGFDQKQTRIGNVLAAASLPISGFFGYKQMQRDQAQAAEIREMKDIVKQRYGKALGLGGV